MSRSMTHAEYVEAVEKVNDKILVVGTYVNKSTKVRVRCKTCDREWDVSPYTPLDGRGCMMCANRNTNRNNMLNIEIIRDKARELDCTVVDRIVENNSIVVKCNRCGYVWNPLVQNFMKGKSRCHCGKNVNTKKTTEQFKKELFAKNPLVTVIGEYINNHTKILCSCSKCGAKFHKSPSKLLAGQSCICSRWFKSEKEAYLYLTEELGLKVEQQKSFKDLVSDKGCRLSYDFYFEVDNKKVLVERQGEQHRFPVDFIGEGKEKAQKNFERQIKHDNLKRKYAKDNGYLLIEIWYDEDYRDVLQKKLNG